LAEACRVADAQSDERLGDWSAFHALFQEVPARPAAQTQPMKMSSFLRAAHPLSVRLMALVLWLCCLPASGWAADVPDAGVVQQQMEQLRRQAAPVPQARPPAPAPRATTAADAGPMLTVSAFDFSGHTLVSADALQTVLAGYTGRAISFTELQRAADTVAAFYRQAGWIVQAYVPPQEVADGRVTITIVEALFGGVDLEGAPPGRISADALKARILLRQPEGQPLHAQVLDRALLIADDLPGVAVSGTLAAGDREGQTRLVLQTTDEPLATGLVTADNTGSRQAGANRLLASVQVASPLKLGDLLSLTALKSKGLRYAYGNFSLPVGADGWRAGVSLSDMNYSASAAGNQTEGSSRTQGLDASYPLLRSPNRNLTLSLTAERKTLQTDLQPAGTRVNKQGVGLAFSQVDASGLGVTSAALGIVRGTVAGNPDAAARFHKLSYSLSRQQDLLPRLNLQVQLTGQASARQLDSSEKFFLGGASGVRAYPISEGGGVRGQLLNVELRWRPAPGVQVAGFQDIGRVSDPWNARVAAGTLRGAGAYLNWRGAQGQDIRLTYAQRQGSNPFANPTTGNDGDGSRVRHRVWLTASVSF